MEKKVEAGVRDESSKHKKQLLLAKPANWRCRLLKHRLLAVEHFSNSVTIVRKYAKLHLVNQKILLKGGLQTDLLCVNMDAIG